MAMVRQRGRGRWSASGWTRTKWMRPTWREAAVMRCADAAGRVYARGALSIRGRENEDEADD